MAAPGWHGRYGWAQAAGRAGVLALAWTLVCAARCAAAVPCCTLLLLPWCARCPQLLRRTWRGRAATEQRRRPGSVGGCVLRMGVWRCTTGASWWYSTCHRVRLVTCFRPSTWRLCLPPSRNTRCSLPHASLALWHGPVAAGIVHDRPAFLESHGTPLLPTSRPSSNA